MHPIDEEGFREWFDWASQYADSIAPILQADLPGEAPHSPKNMPVAELDLTKHTRAIVVELGVSDTDELARVTIDQLREKYGYSVSDPWKEFTRVLEALGYDVAKREKPWY